jgi:hypothetical protein
MGLKDLDGKRSGRRRGSKSAPQWVRDLRRAYKNLGKPDGEILSEGVRYWLAVARERPSEFAAALAQLDRADSRKPEANDTAAGAVPSDRQANVNGATPVTLIAKRPLRVKKLFLSFDHLVKLIRGDLPLPVAHLPHNSRWTACDLDRVRKGLVLAIRSEAFPLVAAGEPIPELE